jgi:hypothetical protein
MVVDLVDTAVNVVEVPTARFAARLPLHLNTLLPVVMPLDGACITSDVAVGVVAADNPTPDETHDNVPDATKTLFVAVIVIVSPSTSASDTPMLNTIDVGAVPTATVLTVVAALHVRRPVVEYPLWPVSGTVDVVDTAPNVTVEAALPLTLKPPVHTIVTVAPAVAAA